MHGLVERMMLNGLEAPEGGPGFRVPGPVAGPVSVLFSDLRNETRKGGDWITLVLNGPYVMTILVLEVQSILAVLVTT